MDPYRNETFPELLMRKREHKPLNILVNTRRVDDGYEFWTAAQITLRYNFTPVDRWLLDESQFADRPTALEFNVSRGPRVSRAMIDAACNDLASAWADYQTPISTNFNVEFDDDGWLK